MVVLDRDDSLDSKILKHVVHHLVLETLLQRKKHHMQIHVKNQTGKLIMFELEMSDTIETLKQLIQESEGLPLAQQRLAFKGKLLQNDKTLSDYQIVKDSIVYIVICTLR